MRLRDGLVCVLVMGMATAPASAARANPVIEQVNAPPLNDSITLYDGISFTDASDPDLGLLGEILEGASPLSAGCVIAVEVSAGYDKPAGASSATYTAENGHLNATLSDACDLGAVEVTLSMVQRDDGLPGSSPVVVSDATAEPTADNPRRYRVETWYDVPVLSAEYGPHGFGSSLRWHYEATARWGAQSVTYCYLISGTEGQSLEAAKAECAPLVAPVSCSVLMSLVAQPYDELMRYSATSTTACSDGDTSSTRDLFQVLTLERQSPGSSAWSAVSWTDCDSRTGPPLVHTAQCHGEFMQNSDLVEMPFYRLRVDVYYNYHRVLRCYYQPAEATSQPACSNPAQ